MLDDLHAMLTGPGRLRFIIQPLLAIILGLRDGKRDAVEGNPPFVLSLLTLKGRKALAREALHQIALPLTIATAMDLLFQYVLFQRAQLWSAIVVGAFLIALPYSVARALGNRFFRRVRARHA